MTFTMPLALLLLLLMPLVIYLGYPRVVYRRGRDLASLGLRIVLLLLLILALAGMQTVQTADKLAVVFLLDVSDSVGRLSEEDELAFVRAAMERMAPDDLAGVVVFGADALVERPLSATRELGPVRSTPVTSNTDLAEALRLGLALFPPDTARRMVVLSDGQPTVGDTEAAAELAAATGVEISYVPFQRDSGPEVQVSSVRVPPAVTAGQQFDLSLTVEAEEAAPATITVLASGEIIHRQDVDLRAGTNNYTLSLTAGGAGFRDFRVQVEPQGNDGFYQNNQLSAFSQVVGPPRVLVIRSSEDDSRYLEQALVESDLTVDVTGPNDLPIGVAPLAQYDSIILANVAATQLSNRRMEILQSYVRDLGGGLVVVGGPDTYGPGGYFQTPLEETLPLDTRLLDQQRVPQLTILYVIDRSGSMGAVGPSGVENLELAKEAIIRSIDFLQPSDRAGVISFDAQGYWIADVQPVFDRLGLQMLVGTLRIGGGTDIMAGMRLAADALTNDPSPRKHIILLTDGGADPTGLVDLTRDLYENYDVTTSTIAIGAGAGDFLDDMANAGGGNYHPVEIVEQIPNIFTIETVLATRSYILEQEFVPSLSGISPIMEGITSAPPLLGYVATSAKQTAQVILRGPADYNDPLLAQWQYGLGRAVAFTSDASGRWAQHWVGWEGFARFWNQAVRWTMTEGANNNLETRVIMEGEQARVAVDARDAAGNFLNGLSLQASLLDPNLEAEQVPLRQVAPGRYEAVFTPGTEGAYFLNVRGGQPVEAEEAVQINQRTGWVMSYSPEYSLRVQGTNTDLLQRIADLTGGRSLADDPGAAFSHNLTMRTASTPLYPWLLLAALLLLPIDIAVRRLIITRSDLEAARRAIFGRVPTPSKASERIAGLRGAKARAQQRAEETASAVSTTAALRAKREQRLVQQTGGDDAPPPPRPSAPSAPRTPAPSAPSASSEEGGTVGKLLQKRKQRE